MNSQNEIADVGNLAPWSLFLLVFAVLGIGNVVATAIVWNYSGDRGWWPVHLGVFLTASCVYALLFSQLSGTALVRWRNAAVYTLVLAVALNAETLLYYWLHMSIDWLAVNEGRVKLTFAQRIIQSAATPWATYGIFLIGAGLLAKRTS